MHLCWWTQLRDLICYQNKTFALQIRPPGKWFRVILHEVTVLPPLLNTLPGLSNLRTCNTALFLLPLVPASLFRFFAFLAFSRHAEPCTCCFGAVRRIDFRFNRLQVFVPRGLSARYSPANCWLAAASAHTCFTAQEDVTRRRDLKLE